MSEGAAKGLPGGVALPAAFLAVSAVGFVVLFKNPELLDLGPHFSPGGVCLLLAVGSFFWLLVAIGKRPPRA